MKNYEIDMNLEKLYEKNLNIEELKVLRTVIFEKYPKYIEEYDKFIKQSKLSPCNMIITKKVFLMNTRNGYLIYYLKLKKE